MKIYRIAKNITRPLTIAMDIDDVYDMVSDASGQIISEFFSKGRKKGSMMSWSVIPISRLSKIWNDYARDGVVRDERGVDEIASQMMRILARIQAATDLSGHSQVDPEELMEEYGYKLTNKNKEDYYWHFLETPYGTPISDYGLNPLWKLATQLMSASSAEQKLLLIDQMLNVVHQRGDLAALFVEGGSSALSKLSAAPEVTEDIKDTVEASNMNWYRTAKKLDPELVDICNKIIPQVAVCLSKGDHCRIEGIDVYLVDGDEVKLNHFMDFVEGGSDMVYEFVPKNTIWIDKNLARHDYPFVILHEFIERHLMDKYGMEYNKAHDITNEYEKIFRAKAGF